MTSQINRTKFTPPELAAMWGKKPETIIALIRSGDLRAIDAALPGKRHRYLIDAADIAAFEARRAVVPPPKVVRRKRRTEPAYREYF
jgi:hypothetical protein